LIYASISGFGHAGPRREEAGYDAMIQAESGLMSITGTADGPAVRLGVAIADISAGMFAFQGILLALIARLRTGRGQHVDIGLLDSAIALLTYQAGVAFATGAAPSRLGNQHAAIAPYDTYDAADGVLILAVGNDEQWQRFCGAAGLGARASDPRFLTNASRVINYKDLRPLVAAAVASKTMAHWTTELRAAGVPCGAVRSVTEALRDPQVLARQMIEVLPHPSIGAVEVLGIPVKLSDTPGAVRSAPPRLGEHTGRVLNELLHLSRTEYRALVDAGVLRPLVPPT
jgi:formyl-CoA transferase/CoA:oxalate CoA-transferase